jgi:acyl-CoA thioesterase-1
MQELQPDSEAERKYILFFGNSLTAGYGLDESESFPSLIQMRIDSIGLPYQVINAGLSGETSAGGLGRIDWVLRQQIDVFVLELGPNDALRGLDLDATEQNLRGILDKVLAKHPDIPIVIAGMEAPPNMGEEYTTQFREIYRKLAEDYNAALIPFLLEGVGGEPELNLPDRMHPNAEGQKIVRDNVWKVLQESL